MTTELPAGWLIRPPTLDDVPEILAVVHAKRRLVGTQVVKADDKDPVVKVGPGGTATGRLVDGDGKPLGEVTVQVHFVRREVAEASEPLNPDNEPAVRRGRRETVTDAAGAFVDSRSIDRAAARGLDPSATLRENDTYPFFAALGDLFTPGPTGTNVMDIKIALLHPLPDRPSLA